MILLRKPVPFYAKETHDTQTISVECGEYNFEILYVNSSQSNVWRQ